MQIPITFWRKVEIMQTWTRYFTRQDWFIHATLNGLVWLAVLSAITIFIIMFVIKPVKADEAIFFGEDYSYGDFYGEDYYRSHNQEILFGSFIPMVRSWSANWNERVVHVEVDATLLTGTDTACRLFGMLMKHITENDVIVVVDNDGYIPSSKNPIDHAWATALAYPDGTYYVPAE